ncbi:hypothetical protein F5Y00DRAFT_197849 [Daldinia vernicosa]|uniref:uncharacterized protein n=1 Tax=Daldinia vernicosa TaxID=114800 RepID=UPI0020077289|nr:uncharacterized protein F5Y00DRAFT_197849 [Daldinia vernicosa]KAI0844566.1 hypothetical protein F5Y00DRAFT_197849 [Daldinia vernicosa]
MEVTTFSEALKSLSSLLFPGRAPALPEKLDEPPVSHANPSEAIKDYLLDRSPEFREISELRQRGWDNPEGDSFFQKQRQNADKSDERTAAYFFNLMRRIGHEIHRSTGAFSVQHGSPYPSILDMCMAPGGFLEVALSKSPTSRALAFSLPASDGGHKVLLRVTSNVEIRYLDVTMLAAEMGVEEVPKDHPDANSFLPRQLELHQLFDLAFCDGQVLRTHARAPYRERREAKRLSSTQLALGLEHLRPGGTMIVLLHKLEAWDTVNILWRFYKFSTVKLLKPKSGHAKRSSFYMVATDVQSCHPEAVRAVDIWKATWKVATFGSDEEYQRMIWDGELGVEQLLDDFGLELMALGKEIWKVQADALAKAPFIQDTSARR